MRYVFLDTGVLSLVTNPKHSDPVERCNQWLDEILSQGDEAVIPEICDYELRRELLRAGKKEGLERLDDLVETLIYQEITTEAMRKAAELWAEARKKGRPTAHDKALDADMILVAQALTFEREAQQGEVIIATTNVGHLGLFADARSWKVI